MLKKIILGLLALLAVFLVIVALQPSTYRVERSLAIAASPADLFAQVNDLRKAQVWSPWVKIDPAAKYTFEGAASGVGAINTWSGNSDVGAGRQTIVESKPNELVRLNLEFFKPMEGTAIAEFAFKPEGARTIVTWSISGPKNFISKVVCLFMSMDAMIGGQVEKGLADLKTLAESPAKK